MCFIGMTVYKYFDIEYIGYKNKKLALYLVFVQTQFQTQTQKQAKVSLKWWRLATEETQTQNNDKELRSV